jgi:ankyrin repeat protein
MELPSIIEIAGGGHHKAVQALQGFRDTDPNIRDNHGQTALARAAIRGHDTVVELLLKDQRTDVDLRDHSGYSPVAWAVHNARLGALKLLVRHGASMHDVGENLRFRMATFMGGKDWDDLHLADFTDVDDFLGLRVLFQT